jgi:DNA topoisomerase-1
MNNKSYITRKSINKKYQYFNNKNIKITNKVILDKINKIYIPPAYKDVKIYLDQKVLATGIDDAGRKQYIYNEKSKKDREEKKRNQIYKLSRNFERLKRKIRNDLAKKDFTKDKLVALVIRIMDLCNFRGGNKTYEKKYGSHGLTTLHKKHITIKNNSIDIEFIGKKGVNNQCVINNPEIQAIIKKVYSLSTKNDPYLFSIRYNDEDINISIVDLNKYLEEFDITSKDLRTWNANIIFLKNFKKEVENLDFKEYDSKTEKQQFKIRKNMIREAIKRTAESLHHTPSICKSSYIFKNIISNIENNEKMLYRVMNSNNNEELLKKFL